MSNKLVIVGNGGHGRVCAEIATLMKLDFLGFCHHYSDKKFIKSSDKAIALNLEELSTKIIPQKVQIFVAIGNNEARMKTINIAEKLGFSLARLIHPDSVCSASLEIGMGTVVMAGVVINSNSSIKKGCIVNTCSSLDHDNVLEKGVQISPGVHSAGNVKIGKETFVGTGATIIPNINIGSNCIIGAGAVVVNNIDNDDKVVGMPAKKIG